MLTLIYMFVPNYSQKHGYIEKCPTFVSVH